MATTPNNTRSPEYSTLLNDKLKEFKIQQKARSRYLQEFAKVPSFSEDTYKQLYVTYRATQDAAEEKANQFQLLQDEYFKLKKQKDQMESLCRSLNEKQKEREISQNKLMEKQDAKRKALADHFQNSIEDINQKFAEHEKQIVNQSATIDALKNENERLLKQIEIKDKQLETLEKKSDLENKLFESQLAEHRNLLEKYNHRNQTLEKQCALLNAKNLELNKQINSYSDNLVSIQESMQESTKVFETFKKDQTSLQKTIRQLQKEKKDLMTKTQKSDLKLLDLFECTQQQSAEIQRLTKRNSTLEQLCRALQTRKVTDKRDETSAEDKTETTAEESSKNDKTTDKEPTKDASEEEVTQQ